VQKETAGTQPKCHFEPLLRIATGKTLPQDMPLSAQQLATFLWLRWPLAWSRLENQGNMCQFRTGCCRHKSSTSKQPKQAQNQHETNEKKATIKQYFSMVDIPGIIHKLHVVKTSLHLSL
jgi:hypothetical protein